MADILFVSKPVEPPWNDSSKNLVRDLASNLARHVPVVMGRKGAPAALPKGRATGVYPPAGEGSFAPSVFDNARVLARLAVAPEALHHYFFAPNARSGAAAKLVKGLRRKPTVHTICSIPRADVELAKVLFADVNVVLSEHSRRTFLERGVAEGRLRRIPPAIAPLEPLSADARREARACFELPSDAPVLVYPGDLEFGKGAEVTLRALAAASRPDVRLVMACRAKTPHAKEKEAELRTLARELGLEGRTTWVGETRRIHDLLGAVDVVALPSDTLYAKMDYPLVILEAMSLARPVLVGRGTPAEELAEGGAARAVEVEVEALSAEIRGLFDDERARQALGARGRSAVLERFTPGPMAASYEALYDSLLG